MVIAVFTEYGLALTYSGASYDVSTSQRARIAHVPVPSTKVTGDISGFCSPATTLGYEYTKWATPHKAIRRVAYPVLVVILTISEQSNDYLEIVNDYLRQHNKTFVFMGGGDAVGVLVR